MSKNASALNRVLRLVKQLQHEGRRSSPGYQYRGSGRTMRFYPVLPIPVLYAEVFRSLDSPLQSILDELETRGLLKRLPAERVPYGEYVQDDGTTVRTRMHNSEVAKAYKSRWAELTADGVANAGHYIMEHEPELYDRYKSVEFTPEAGLVVEIENKPKGRKRLRLYCSRELPVDGVQITKEGLQFLDEVSVPIPALAAPAAADATQVDAQPDPPAVDDDSHLAPARLAELFAVPADALRTRLNRWRQKNHVGWIENTERGGQDAQYLYRVGAVRHIIDKMRATS